MRSGRADYLVIGIMAFAILVLSAFVIASESQVYLARLTTKTIASELLAGIAPAGLSVQSKSDFFADCRTALSTVQLRARPHAQLVKAVGTCRSVADRAAANSPSMSIAWFTGAFASIIIGDVEGFNARFLRAYLSGPNEQWLAELRFDLAERNYSDLHSNLLPHYAHDLRLLLASSLAVDRVAMRYLDADDETRQRIDQIAADLPKSVRERFGIRLSDLRRDGRDPRCRCPIALRGAGARKPDPRPIQSLPATCWPFWC